MEDSKSNIPEGYDAPDEFDRMIDEWLKDIARRYPEKVFPLGTPTELIDQ